MHGKANLLEKQLHMTDCFKISPRCKVIMRRRITTLSSIDEEYSADPILHEELIGSTSTAEAFCALEILIVPAMMLISPCVYG